MNNQADLRDSITYYETKNDDLVYQKGIFIVSEKGIEKTKSVLYEEVKYIKGDYKAVVTIQRFGI